MNTENTNNTDDTIPTGKHFTNLYIVYDADAQSADGPIIKHRNETIVLRDFYRLLDDQKGTIAAYPEAYNLVHVGVQDEQTGEVYGTGARIVARGKEWANVRKANTNTEK